MYAKQYLWLYLKCYSSLLAGAQEIRSILVATVTAVQFSREIFSCKLDYAIKVKDEA